MKIKKVIRSTINQKYFFAEGSLDINANYFIQEIEKGINENNNANYKTHVRGKMTSQHYFVRDNEFIKLILPMLDYIDQTNFDFSDPTISWSHPSYYLREAWGYKEGFGDYTREHSHGVCWLSGVIYLNKHHQKLIFPQINKEVTPEKGTFVLFSPFLLHKTKRNITKKSKYGISFNWYTDSGIFDSL